jgi:ABC-2 type transport system permease protein
LTWGITVAALAFVFFSFFTVFGEQSEMMNEMLSKMPEEFLIAFGMNNMNYGTVLGYISFFFLFIQLCLAIQASNFGFGLVSIEENEMTADFLLTKPVSRTKIMTSKLLAAISSLLLTDLFFWASIFISISIFAEGREYSMPPMILLLFSVVIFQLFFFSVGLMISLLVKRVRSVTPYSLGLAFGAYVLSAFSGVFGDVKLEYITPFKHFESGFIVDNAAYNTPLVLINVAVTIISLTVAYWLYLRRDIHAVS